MRNTTSQAVSRWLEATEAGVAVGGCSTISRLLPEEMARNASGFQNGLTKFSKRKIRRRTDTATSSKSQSPERDSSLLSHWTPLPDVKRYISDTHFPFERHWPRSYGITYLVLCVRYGRFILSLAPRDVTTFRRSESVDA